MRIAIVAGGTGGHIYPGIALAYELKKRNPKTQVIFIGSEEGLEKELVSREGFEIKLIKARALLRKISYKAISAPFVSSIGFFQSLKILKSFAPQYLLSFGGYVSFPVVLAAWFLGIPVLIHEQNVIPGFVNRVLAKIARKVFLSFDESKDYMAGEVVGNPVRSEIILAEREEARYRLGCALSDFVILVMGGSQGARKINEVILRSLPLIKERNILGLKIFHIVGKRDAQMIDRTIIFENYPFYHKVDYLYNISEVLPAADLVVSRAGATAIAEFLVCGLPMILIPFPYSAEDHQKLNAEIMVKAGAAVMIENDHFSEEKFISTILELKPRLRDMGVAAKKIAKPDAAGKIVDWIFTHERT